MRPGHRQSPDICMKIFQLLLPMFLVASCGGGGSGPADTLNTEPVAVLNDKALYLGQLAVLDGSGSNDADGEDITYS